MVDLIFAYIIASCVGIIILSHLIPSICKNYNKLISFLETMDQPKYTPPPKQKRKPIVKKEKTLDELLDLDSFDFN